MIIIRLFFLLVIFSFLFYLIFKIISFKDSKDKRKAEANIFNLINKRFQKSIFKDRLIQTIKKYLSAKETLKENLFHLKTLEKEYGKENKEEVLRIEDMIKEIDNKVSDLYFGIIKEKIKIEESTLSDYEKDFELFKKVIEK
jgi:hypothetical protein